MVGDETGTVTLKWFRGGESIAKLVRKDVLLLVAGDVKRYRFSKQLAASRDRSCSRDAEAAAEPAGANAPSCAASRRTTPRPRASTRARCAAPSSTPSSSYADLLAGHLPAALVRELALPEPAQALRELHQPPLDSDLEALRAGATPAYTRLVLEELYLLELGLALRREGRAREPAIPIAGDGRWARAAIAGLPFRLTRAQARVWERAAGRSRAPASDAAAARGRRRQRQDGDRAAGGDRRWRRPAARRR